MKCRPEKLDVSRAVMREAFGALAALKQLDVANGRRANVGALDGSVLADSFEHAISTAQIGMAEVWNVRRTIEIDTYRRKLLPERSIPDAVPGWSALIAPRSRSTSTTAQYPAGARLRSACQYQAETSGHER